MTPTVDRRVFLQSGFAAIGSSLLVAHSPLALAGVRDGSGRRSPSDNGRRLVVVQLRGGNDGLNTVVPYTSGRYRELRPALAVATEDVLPLTDRLGLHPTLAPILPWWNDGRMAILQNVGYPEPDLSHFRSEAIWYTADPEVQSTDGWLGAWHRALAAPAPVGLTTVGTLPSPAMVADGWVPAAVADPDTFGFDLVTLIPADSELKRELVHQAFAEAASDDNPLGTVAATGLAAEAVVDLVTGIPPQNEPPVPYPSSDLAGDLATTARLLGAGIGTRVVWVATGGYDTHADQIGVHPTLLTDLAEALAAFMADLEVRGLGHETAVLVWSEFGRRAYENGSVGTDHGAGAPALVLGRPVEGGLIGDPPDLDDLDAAGNLKYDIDFRAVYETVLADHLGVDPRLVLPQPFERLGIFR